jgi:hypothetical protein
MRKKKSLIIIAITIGCVIVVSVTLATVYHFSGRMDHLRLYEDRIKGYYLCEAGASKVLDLLQSGIKVPPGGLKGAISFPLGEETFSIYYQVDDAASPEILTWVKLEEVTYKLEIGANREQWPLFIKGVLPPLM